MHWLAKEEIAHTTKFESLVSLAINIGAKDVKALAKDEKKHIYFRENYP